jgi:hypothetical protein
MTTDDLAKAIATSETMLKSHVKQHTRKTASGAVIQVKEHDDSRSKKTKASGHPHPYHAYAGDLAEAAKGEHREYEDNSEAWHVAAGMREAAKDMKNKDHAGLKATLADAYDNYTKEKIIQHIHPDHWEGLGIEAIDKKRSVRDFEAKHSKNVEAYVEKFGDKMKGTDRMEVGDWVEGIGQAATKEEKAEISRRIMAKYYKPAKKSMADSLGDAISRSETLIKAHVKASQRKTASGAVVQVKEHDDSRSPSHRHGRKLLAENAAHSVGGMGQHDDGSGVSTALAPHSPGDEEKHVAAFREHMESNGFKPRKDVTEIDSKEGDLHYKHPNGAQASILTRNWIGKKGSKQKRVSLEIHSGVKDDQNTPWNKTEKSQLDSAITRSETLLKAHVKASQRKTASGAVVQVKEHEDGRKAAAASQAANQHHSKADFDSPDDMNRAAKLHTEAAMKHIQAFHSGRGAGDEEASNHYYKASGHLGSAHATRTFIKGHEVEAAKEASKTAETLSKVANKHQVEHTAANLDVGASTHLLAMEQHQRARDAHEKAANAKYGDTAAMAEHEKQAQKHNAAATEHGKKVQEIAGVTIKATAKARTLGEHAKTAEEHIAASQAHSEAAKLNYDSEGRAEHEKMAKFHAGKAGKDESAAGEKRKTDSDTQTVKTRGGFSRTVPKKK